MSEAGNPQEPSMEEILASIRKIISEDGEEEAPQTAAAEPEPQDEPMELTDEVPQPEEPLELTEEAVGGGEHEIEVFDAAPEPMPEPEPTPEPDPLFGNEPASLPEPPLSPFVPMNETTESIMSDLTKVAAAAKFGELARKVDAPPRSSLTVEQMAEDLMRPMLRQWLDDNLPDMVERLVRREIERMARNGEDC